MRQGAAKHKEEKMPPADMDAGSQSPWLVGGRAVIAAANHTAHASGDGLTSAEVSVGAVRM